MRLGLRKWSIWVFDVFNSRNPNVGSPQRPWRRPWQRQEQAGCCQVSRFAFLSFGIQPPTYRVKSNSPEESRTIPEEFQTSASASRTVISEATRDTMTRTVSRPTRQALEAGIQNIQNTSATAISNYTLTLTKTQEGR